MEKGVPQSAELCGTVKSSANQVAAHEEKIEAMSAS
jgi:hypothetical protein